MKRSVSLLISFCFLFAVTSADNIGQTIEDLELNLEIQEIIIDNADSAGKDVSTLRGLLGEFEDAVDNLQIAYDEHGEGIETQRAQNVVWSKLVEMNEEYERLGINLDDEGDSDAKEKVEEAIEGLEVHLEILDTLIEVAEVQGKNTGDVKRSLNTVKEHYEGMIDLYEDGEYDDAQRELFRLYIAMPELQEELEELGIGEEEDNRPVKERVEDVLTKFEYPLQVLVLLLDNADLEGKDTGTARETLEEMEIILEEVHDLYDNGDYNDAWNKVMRLFVLGVRLQNDFREIGINLEDDRTSQEKVKEAIEDFEVHEESIEFVFLQASKKGRDVSTAENIFNEMKVLMEEVERLYDAGRYEESEMVLLQVFLKSPEFQEEFQKLVKSLEETPEEMRAKLQKILEEYEANLPLIEQMIDIAEGQGKDVSRIRTLLGKFKGYMEQVRGLAKGGADGIVIETMSDPEEARIAIEAAKEACVLDVACTFTFSRNQDGAYRTMMGTDVGTYMEMVKSAGADIIGANCGNGTAGMTEIVREIRAIDTEIPVLVHANAGLPLYKDGKTVFPESPGEMASQIEELVAAGVNIVGGCCGTTPEHIRQIVQVISNMV